MTTFITSESNPRLPAPSAYARHLEKLNAEREITRQRNRQNALKVWLFIGAWLFTAGLIAAFAYYSSP